MPTPPENTVSHVSDTARWVAMYRALESDRPDALFHDPWARRLAGPQGEAILDSIPRGREFSWTMVVRTQVMDELLMRSVREDGVDAVLNLAAGLDARPYRLPLPPSLRWIEVDFPDMLAYKRSILGEEPARCIHEFAPADLTDDHARSDLFARVGSSARRVFVITEGLIGYLQRDQVARLAEDLGRQYSFHWWMTDLASPELIQRIRKMWGKSLERTPLIFGPEEGTGFFEPFGWREKEYRPIFEESFRLNRTMRFARFFRLLGRLAPKERREKFRRFSGIVLFERK